MNPKTIALAVLFAALGLVLVGGSAALAATAGANPSAALDLSTAANWQTLNAGGTMWYQIPYHAATVLEIQLDGYNVGGVQFEVYTAEQLSPDVSTVLSGPIGRGSPNPDEPSHDLTWAGRFVDDRFVYVMVKNTSVWNLPFRLDHLELIPGYVTPEPPTSPAPVIRVRGTP